MTLLRIQDFSFWDFKFLEILDFQEFGPFGFFAFWDLGLFGHLAFREFGYTGFWISFQAFRYFASFWIFSFRDIDF